MKKIVIMLAFLLSVSVGVNLYLYNQLSAQTALANAAEEQQKELTQKMTDLQAQIDGLQSEITNLKTENESLRATLAESQVESSAAPTVEEIIASMGDEELFNSSSSTASKPVEQQKPPVNSSSKPSGGSGKRGVAPGGSSGWTEDEIDYGRGPAGPDGNLGFS